MIFIYAIAYTFIGSLLAKTLFSESDFVPFLVILFWPLFLIDWLAEFLIEFLNKLK